MELKSDTVRLLCPNLRCKTVLCVPSQARGRTVRCRQCGTLVKIPLAPNNSINSSAAKAPAPTSADEANAPADSGTSNAA